MLEKKGIKKIGFWGQKGSTDRGYGQPVKEPVDQLWSSCRGPVEGDQKPSLSPSNLLFPVEVRSRTGRGPVEVTVTCHALNAPTASEPVDP